MNGLPVGRAGQALALALTALVIAAAWLGGVAPALDWYAGRGERLAEQRTLAARMAQVGATAPALQQQVAQAGRTATPARAVFDGATDAIASAALQQAVQDMAAKAGATVSSAEALPSEAVGGYRRISLHVSVSAPWPVMVALLQAVAEATPRMLVDDLTLRQGQFLGRVDGGHPMEAGFTVIAFHEAGQQGAVAP